LSLLTSAATSCFRTAPAFSRLLHSRPLGVGLLNTSNAWTVAAFRFSKPSSVIAAAIEQGMKWGGRRDLNPRQPDPQSGALTRLSYDHHPTRAKLILFAPVVKLRAGRNCVPGITVF